MQIKYMPPRVKEETKVRQPTGSERIAGATGVTGMGMAGQKRVVVHTGATRGMGATGVKGAMGTVGATGATGATGTAGAAGVMGATGATGATGARGAMGATGATGAAGPRGADGSNAIVPFASGAPITITTMAGGLAGIPSFIAFGTSVQGAHPQGPCIDLSMLPGLAFSLPRDGSITSLAAIFSIAGSMTLKDTIVSLTAQLYEAAPSSNIFEPVPGVYVTLSPSLTGLVDTGSVSSGLRSGLLVPVTAGTRLLLAFYVTAAGATLINTVVGYASGGLSIA